MFDLLLAAPGAVGAFVAFGRRGRDTCWSGTGGEQKVGNLHKPMCCLAAAPRTVKEYMAQIADFINDSLDAAPTGFPSFRTVFHALKTLDDSFHIRPPKIESTDDSWFRKTADRIRLVLRHVNVLATTPPKTGIPNAVVRDLSRKCKLGIGGAVAKTQATVVSSESSGSEVEFVEASGSGGEASGSGDPTGSSGSAWPAVADLFVDSPGTSPVKLGATIPDEDLKERSVKRAREKSVSSRSASLEKAGVAPAARGGQKRRVLFKQAQMRARRQAAAKAEPEATAAAEAAAVAAEAAPAEAGAAPGLAASPAEAAAAEAAPAAGGAPGAAAGPAEAAAAAGPPVAAVGEGAEAAAAGARVPAAAAAARAARAAPAAANPPAVAKAAVAVRKGWSQHDWEEQIHEISYTHASKPERIYICAKLRSNAFKPTHIVSITAAVFGAKNIKDVAETIGREIVQRGLCKRQAVELLATTKDRSHNFTYRHTLGPIPHGPVYKHGTLCGASCAPTPGLGPRCVPVGEKWVPTGEAFARGHLSLRFRGF